MRKIIPLSVCLMFGFRFCFSQNLTKLEVYLKENSFSISPNELNEKKDVFKNIMRNKKLFVLGEGASHNLKMYKPLKAYLIHQFVENNLKYYFFEGSRSIAYSYNQYLQEKNITTKYPLLEIYMKPVKTLYEKGLHFEYRGIDMERSRNFYNSVKDILRNHKSPEWDAIKVVKEILVDTVYLHHEENVFLSNQKFFLNNYKIWKKDFYRDSVKIKHILAEGEYKKLKYLLSNNQTNHPLANRNLGMAENLLGEIFTNDTTEKYFLSIGIAHSMPNDKGSVVEIINRSEKLNNKMVVMNVYCDSCKINGVSTDDRSLRFMNDPKIKAIFNTLSVNSFTIFDLSNIPPEFNYLKEYGDLILYTKHQE